MRIVFAIPVRYADRLDDGTLVAVGIEQNVFVRDEYPGRIAVPLIIQIAASALESESDQPFPLVVRVIGSDLTEIQEEVSDQFFVNRHPRTPPGWDTRMTHQLSVELEIEGPGGYSISITAGDSDPCDIPIVCE